MKCAARLVLLLVVHCACEYSEEDTTRTTDATISAVQHASAVVKRHEDEQDGNAGAEIENLAQGNVSWEIGGNVALAENVDLQAEQSNDTISMLMFGKSMAELRGQYKPLSEYQKQVAWVAKFLGKVEGKICKRDVYWGGRRCMSNYNSDKSWCYEKCPNHIVNYRCYGGHYCASSKAMCNKKFFKLFQSILDVLAFFVPAGKTMSAIKLAVQKGEWWKLARLGATYVTETVAKAHKEGKANLKAYFQKEKKQVKDSFIEYILTGGSQAFAAKVVEEYASRVDGWTAIKDEAVKLFKAVDPTGLSGLFNTFKAEPCDEKHIEPFPLNGLTKKELK